jgi:PAS domain S-box-containing protein
LLVGIGVLCGHLCLPALTIANEQKRVLVFYPTRRDAPAVATMDRVLAPLLSAGLNGHLDYYSEFLDVARFPDVTYQAALRDFLRTKYGQQPLDLIISTTGATLEFVAKYGLELFPDVPVVFLGDAASRPSRTSTGLSPGLDLRKTIDVALELQPETKQVFIVSGTSEFDRFYEDLARQQLRPLEKRVAFTYLTGLSLAEVQRKVANLPADSILYPVMFEEDSSGSHFVPVDALERIAAVANAPVYSWHETAIGRGIVGGSLQSSEIQARRLGELALRVLRGEHPANIPVIEIDTNVNTFDWRQLRRWGISDDRLPANSVIRFREPGLWEQYKAYIAATSFVLFLQTALIAGLLVHRAKRKRAEKGLRESEERFRVMADTAPVLIWASGTDKLRNFFNRPWLEFRGRTFEQERGNGWAEGVHGDDLDRCLSTYVYAFDSREPFRMEYRLQRFDGEYRWVLDAGVPRFAPDGTFVGYLGSCIDITERRQAEEGSRENEAALRASYAQVKDLAGRLIVAQEVERTRIARDLHDDVSQQLAGLSIALSGFKRRLHANAPGAAMEDELAAIQRRTTELADEIRNLSHELHPGVLQHAGLAAALKAHCREFEQQNEVRVTLDTTNDIGGVDAEAAVCLYRVAQETLRNVAKHAHARHVHVTLARNDGALTLSISDDGRGFDLAEARTGDGLGLVSIDERVRLANGTVTIHTRPQHGTRVQVRIPVSASPLGKAASKSSGQ